MASLLKDPVALGPVLIYLFHRISISLDGTPSIIVLDEAWALIDNPVCTQDKRLVEGTEKTKCFCDFCYSEC